jgi:hypothetical protein
LASGRYWWRNNLPVNVRDGDLVKAIPAGYTVFRVGDDGKLTFARNYDIDVGDRQCSGWGCCAMAATAEQRRLSASSG